MATMSFWEVRNLVAVQWFKVTMKNCVYILFTEFTLQVHFCDCSGIYTIQFMFLHFNFVSYSKSLFNTGVTFMCKTL